MPGRLIVERSWPSFTVTLPPLIVTLPDVASLATRIPEAGTTSVAPSISVTLPKETGPSPADSFLTTVNVPPSTVMEPVLAAALNPMESAPAPSFTSVPLKSSIVAIEDERLFVTVMRVVTLSDVWRSGRLAPNDALSSSSKWTFRRSAPASAHVPVNFLTTNVPRMSVAEVEPKVGTPGA